LIYLATLAIFSSLSMNLLLSFAVGISSVSSRNIQSDMGKKPLPVFQILIMFLAVLLLWAFFSFLIPLRWRMFSFFFLFFPLSSLACIALERLFKWLFPKLPFDEKKVFSPLTAYDGLVPVSLLLTFVLAGAFSGALVLSFFFAAGNLTAVLVLNEIRRRAFLEQVPLYLKGNPLLLISMGLLSLISTSVGIMAFRLLDAH